MKGNIFSPEDKEFMEIVQSDLRRYLEKNIFPSRTVLVFPPFNGFRRFLIHKLIEDNFAASEVAAFSIGQDISRRIVICYKGLISESKGLPATIPQLPTQNMIDKEKPSRQRQTPTAAVYRPPAARIAERKKSLDNVQSGSTKQTRVRRPDQQMYVPRPKRASYGSDLPRSRSRSDSRLSLDGDQILAMTRSSEINSEETKVLGQSGAPEDRSDVVVMTLPSDVAANDNKLDISSRKNSEPPSETRINTKEHCEIIDSKYSMENERENIICSVKESETSKNESEKISDIDEMKNQEVAVEDCSKSLDSKDVKEGEMQIDLQNDENSVASAGKQNKIIVNENNILSSSPSKKIIDDEEENTPMKIESTPNEEMETVSISSESRSEDSSSSFTSSSSSSKTSDSSVDSIPKKCCKHKKSEKMDTDHDEGKSFKNQSKSRSQHQETKPKKKVEPSTMKISEVLVISDTSSSSDSTKLAEENKSKRNRSFEKPKSQPLPKFEDVKSKNSDKQNKKIDPDEYDWESLYDDRGECLVPSLMEELTNSVGRVRVTSADSDYRPYQSIEERTSDGECVIEIYDFPAEFKTTDLFNIFAAYRNKNFQIKWVDDTHALGIFPSPLMADEVLACTLPYVKTRPLRLGIVESRNKARSLVLPPLPSVERPKTCTALARRLVTGALGLRVPTSSQEREMEKQVLKEAREKRRLEAKQREAAWDGTITSSSAI